MDFLVDALFDGRRFRVLAIVDNYSKKCLCLMAGSSLKGVDIREALERVIVNEHVVPKRVQCDTVLKEFGKILSTL